MQILANVTFNTSRSTYAPSTGSSVPTSHLTGVSAYVEAVHAGSYGIPMAALDSSLKLKVDTSVDIVEGDVITSITKNRDGTSWLPVNTQEVLTVSFIDYRAPGFLEGKICYVKRDVIGGPAK